MSTGQSHSLEGKLQLLFEASASLIGSAGAAELFPRFLDLAIRLTGAGGAALWREDVETSTWRITHAVGLSAEYCRGSLISQSGIIGEQPYCIEDTATSTRVGARRAVYDAEGIRSLLAMPLKIAGAVCGTVAFYYRAPREFSESDLRVAAALACLAASAIETADLYREQEQARTRAAFLAEASAVLASSLDYEATLAAVARLAVPQIADWCVVDMKQGDGCLERLACAHVDPRKVAWAAEMGRKYPVPAGAPDGPHSVVRTGRSVLCETISDELLAARAHTPEHLELLRGLGLTSCMIVPLRVRQETLGALTFVSANPERRYDAVDLALAEDLARRAAMAIDNSLLYAAARRERAALETALAALRENEDRLLLAMEAGRLGIWHWDLKTSAVEITDNAAALLGFSGGRTPDTLRAILDAMHPDDQDGFIECTGRAVQENSYFECEFRRAGKRQHWLAAKGKVLCDDSGTPVRIIGIFMDIDERRLLDEKLRGAQKLESVGLLAGGIAHDFNNLLTGILGNSSLALDLLSPRHDAAPLLHNVVDASERAADLTRQLLAYSGKGRVLVEPVDVSALVSGIVHLLQSTVPKLITLQLNLDDSLPAVEADASQLQQVVMNLITNAAEAIGSRAGTITVRTCLHSAETRVPGHPSFTDLEPGSYVCLEVRDDGSGMDPNTVSRMFDPFFSTKFTGRGLGLAAVSGIVRAHHGGVRVQSAVGTGSCFEVFFPALASAAPVPRPDAEFEDLTGSGLILVVDDESAVRSTAAAALRRYGYRVVVAPNGAEAVDLFSDNPGDYAAVVLDLTMPVLGGEEAARHIKQLRPQVPLLLSSGYDEVHASSRFEPGVINAFLQKPYTAAALARALKRVLPRAFVQRPTLL